MIAQLNCQKSKLDWDRDQIRIEWVGRGEDEDRLTEEQSNRAAVDLKFIMLRAGKHGHKTNLFAQKLKLLCMSVQLRCFMIFRSSQNPHIG